MNYRTIRLTDIAMRTLTPFKVSLAHYGAQDHSRWVLRGAPAGGTDTFFYKIWNPTYVRRDNILAAIESGFYDERLVPALYGIIFHKGLCRGYVMHEGKIEHGALMEDFRELVFLRTHKTGYFTVQFARWHTMVYKNRLSLLDLEAAYPIKAFCQLSHYHCRFEDSDYENFVAGSYKELRSRITLTNEASAHDSPFAASQVSTSGVSPRLGSGVPSIYGHLSRRMVRKVRNIMPRMSLIEY